MLTLAHLRHGVATLSASLMRVSQRGQQTSTRVTRLQHMLLVPELALHMPHRSLSLSDRVVRTTRSFCMAALG
jgi:hypothetical protein